MRNLSPNTVALLLAGLLLGPILFLTFDTLLAERWLGQLLTGCFLAVVNGIVLSKTRFRVPVTLSGLVQGKVWLVALILFLSGLGLVIGAVLSRLQ